ncbi:MAG: hypothetical protein LBU62_00455 [Bacteroidales bacterium]|jgi:hypothetical protein|nr:hypothetical protein [Bacteroidales bacterium]
MKEIGIMLIICVFAGMVLSSCVSNKPCPAYRTVSSVEQTVEQQPV